MTAALHQDEETDRPLRPALMRGWRKRCPQCGNGSMMQGYLSVRSSCGSCGEDLSHQRADDGPAYATILIVGHLMAPVLLWSFIEFRPDPIVLAIAGSVLCGGLSLFLLPRLKGMFVALQWSRRMHGFGAGGNAGH